MQRLKEGGFVYKETGLKNLIIQISESAGKYGDKAVAAPNALPLKSLPIKSLVLFDSALENEIIAKNPVTKSVKCTNG